MTSRFMHPDARCALCGGPHPGLYTRGSPDAHLVDPLVMCPECALAVEGYSQTTLERIIAANPPHKGLQHEIRAWDHFKLCRFAHLRIPITASCTPGKGANAGPHMQLKRAAADWLVHQRGSNPQMERSYPGGQADVLCRTRRVAFECGYTDPRKLIRAAETGWIAIWLPYASRERRLGEMADGLAVSIPHRRRGERRPLPRLLRPPTPTDSSARYLVV